MNRTQVKRLLAVVVLVAVFGAAFFASYLTSGGRRNWLNVLAIEVRAACRDPGTQWMVILCAGIYFITFTVLQSRISNPPLTPPSRGTFGFYNPDLWLCVFLLIVSLTYAFDYGKASASLQPLLLLVGAAVGKGVALWVQWAGREERQLAEPNRADTAVGVPMLRRILLIVGILVALLACAALWQPETTMSFQYRGVRRWSGPWDNPNIYGMLMAVGFVLAVGFLIQIPKSKLQCLTAENAQNAEAEISLRNLRSLRLKKFWSAIRRLAPFVAGCLCGYGLLRSYSRGAWMGAAAGLVYLFCQSVRKTHLAPALSPHLMGGEGESFPRRSWWRDYSHPLSVVLLSVVVLSFWQFRHTDWPPARRLFSVANVNDFSWRNRVTAWQGALQMMTDKPLAGFGWGKAEETYRTEYRHRRLEETAAIQMNDYLMLGISSGVPALLCFVAFLALSFRCRTERVPSDFGVQISDRPTVCRAGALVLLVGFWFDGGLFKLPTAAVFWTLLELGRSAEFIPRGPVHSLDSRNKFRAPAVENSLARIGLRWLAGILAVLALGLSAVHLLIPQMAATERTLSLARRFIVSSKQHGDFDFLTVNHTLRGKPLKTLLTHMELASYNRELVLWKVDDERYRNFILSPEIDPLFDGQMNWRRPLWEHFYPRIRREISPQAAAEIVRHELEQMVSVGGSAAGHYDIQTMWQASVATNKGFRALFIAALRSVGIPAKFNEAQQAEFWTGEQWSQVNKNLN